MSINKRLLDNLASTFVPYFPLSSDNDAVATVIHTEGTLKYPLVLLVEI